MKEGEAEGRYTVVGFRMQRPSKIKKSLITVLLTFPLCFRIMDA